MNYFLKLLLVSIGAFFLSTSISYAARVYMDVPDRASANRTPVTVLVYLDTEKDILSGLSGALSFPSELFDIDSISTQGSIVSVWMNSPAVSDEKYLDSRVHITFEGIMPGGFSGVRSPYYKGTLPGKLFSVTLIPKLPGVGTFVLDNIELHAYDSEATLLKSESEISVISVPNLTGVAASKDASLSYVKSPTLTTMVTRDELINRNAWYLSVNESESVHSIKNIYVAESDESSPERVPAHEWKKASLSYILLYQSRTKYIHTKLLYSNNTYTFKTIEPVDNVSHISYLSRILIGVLLSLLFLYHYGKTILHFFSKNN